MFSSDLNNHQNVAGTKEKLIFVEGQCICKLLCGKSEGEGILLNYILQIIDNLINGTDVHKGTGTSL